MDGIINFFRDIFMIAVVVPIIIILIFIILRIKRKRDIARQQQLQQEQARRESEQRRRKEEEDERKAQQALQKRLRETEQAIDQNPISRQYRLDKTQSEVTVPTLNITEFTPISKKRYVAFDLETTGLNPGCDSIVEIGAVRVEDGVITDEYHQLVDPECPMPSEASAVNHITDNMLSGQPKIHQVLPAFLAFIGDDVLAAHNVAFDIRFISQACMRNRFRVPVSCFDTMNLSRYWPEAENKKLTTLASAAGIETAEAHRALGDARTVAALIDATNKRRANKSKK